MRFSDDDDDDGIVDVCTMENSDTHTVMSTTHSRTEISQEKERRTTTQNTQKLLLDFIGIEADGMLGFYCFFVCSVFKFQLSGGSGGQTN